MVCKACAQLVDERDHVACGGEHAAAQHVQPNDGSVTCTLLVRHIHTETTKLVKTTFVHSFSKHRVSELSD